VLVLVRASPSGPGPMFVALEIGQSILALEPVG